MLKAGLDAEQAFVGNKNGDAQGGARRRGEEGRGGLRLSVPEPREHGADERDGALDAGRAARSGAPTQNGEAALAAAAEAAGLPADKCDVLQDASRRRLRPARRCHDYVTPGGADRQADAGHAGQADLVARGGHDARPLPPGHAVQADRRPRRAGQPDRAAHAHLGPVDPRRRASRRRSRTARIPSSFQGSEPDRAEALVRLHASRTC